MRRTKIVSKTKQMIYKYILYNCMTMIVREEVKL